MPVYWHSIPAQIKGVIDRVFSLVVGGKDIAGKEYALITCCEERDMSVMDGVRIPMERMCALNKWKMVGEVLVPGAAGWLFRIRFNAVMGRSSTGGLTHLYLYGRLKTTKC